MGGDFAGETELQRRLDADLEALARVQVLVSRGTMPPELPRQSLPVRAAAKGYRLSKAAAALVGLLVAIAEMVAPDRAVFRTVLDAIFDWNEPAEVGPPATLLDPK